MFHLIFLSQILKKFKYWYGGINFFNKKFCLKFEKFGRDLKHKLFSIKWISFFITDTTFPSFFQKTIYSTWFYFVLKNNLSTCLSLKYCQKNNTISNLFKNVFIRKKKISIDQQIDFFRNFFFCVLNLKILAHNPF